MIKGMKQYEAAEAVGMSESAFSRKLRKELPPDEQQRMKKLIEAYVPINKNT